MGVGAEQQAQQSALAAREKLESNIERYLRALPVTLERNRLHHARARIVTAAFACGLLAAAAISWLKYGDALNACFFLVDSLLVGGFLLKYWRLENVTSLNTPVGCKQLETSGLASRLAAGVYLDDDPLYKNASRFTRLFHRQVTGANPDLLLQRIAVYLPAYMGTQATCYEAEISIGIFIAVVLGIILLPTQFVANIGMLLALRHFMFVISAVLLIWRGVSGNILLLDSYLRQEWERLEQRLANKLFVDYIHRLADPRAVARYTKLARVLNDLEYAFSLLNSVYYSGWWYLCCPAALFSVGSGLIVALAALLVSWKIHGRLERWVYHRWGAKYSQLIRERVACTSLIKRIADDEVDASAIYSYVPGLFRFNMGPPPGSGRAANFRETVLQVGRNLDWFLTPPHRLIRLIWLTGPVIFIICTTLFGYMMFPLVISNSQLLWPIKLTSISPAYYAWVFALALLSILVCIPTFLHRIKLVVWSEVLISEMRALLLSEQSGTCDPS